MDIIVAVVLFALYTIIWGVILWSDWRWKKHIDEKRAKRYEENEEYEYGHNVKYYSNDED